MNWMERARALAFPRRCPFCNAVLGEIPLCPACAPQMGRWRLVPHRLSQGEHYLGRLEGAASAYRYSGPVRAAILQAKGGRRWYAKELGNLLAVELFGCTFYQKDGILALNSAGQLRSEYDGLVPVPPTNGERGYNVPALLAQPLAQASGLPLWPGCLRRVRNKRRQEGLTKDQRLENAAGAFALAPGGPDVAGKRLLLVDDVITTGATVAACGQALLAAGAESVYAVSVAATRLAELS